MGKKNSYKHQLNYDVLLDLDSDKWESLSVEEKQRISRQFLGYDDPWEPGIVLQVTIAVITVLLFAVIFGSVAVVGGLVVMFVVESFTQPIGVFASILAFTGGAIAAFVAYALWDFIVGRRK